MLRSKSYKRKPKFIVAPEPVPTGAVKAEPYFAFTVLKKPNTGGLFIMRKLTIYGDQVVAVEDNVENLGSIQIAKVGDSLEEIAL